MKRVGEMIYSLRCEKNIPQKKLARGILSVAELSRIENGTKEASSLVLETLLQRLGKSLDRLEYMVSSDEYHEICLKEMIRQALACEDYDVVEVLLEEYEEYELNSSVLCRQFAMQVKAIVEYVKTRDTKQCYEKLRSALELTYTGWDNDKKEEVYLCTQEIQILLAMYYIQLMEQNISGDKIEELVQYIDAHYTEKKERAKIYPQAAWLAGRAAYADGDFGKAYKFYQLGEKCLAENGVLVLMSKILEDEKRCLEKLGRQEEVTKKEKERKAIEFLYECVNKKMTTEDILFFVLKSHQGEVVVSNELLRELREAKGLSQEQVSEGVCTQETLCRIETQKRAPKRKTVREIFEKLDYDRQFFQGYVVSDDYYAYELVGAINENWYKKNNEEAYRLLAELEGMLDLSIPINRQYVEHGKLQRKVEEGEMSREEAVEELKCLLRYTMKDYVDRIYRTPTRQEFIIINHMAICLKKLGRMEEAEKVYQQVINCYEKNSVDASGHMASQFLLYINYVGLLEEENKIIEAKEVGWQGLDFMLDCQKGAVAASLLSNIACVYEKMLLEEEKKFGITCLQMCYVLMLLYQHEKDAEKVSLYYKHKYRTTID